jgi:hypothetical protein
MALIGGTKPHEHLSLCLSHLLQSLLGWPPLGGGILPSGRCGGGWGPMGLTADDLWEVSHEAQPNSMSIEEDIGSHTKYP